MTNPVTKGKGKAVAWLHARVGHTGDECVIWPFGGSQQRGHGRLGFNGETLYAHRYMCELANGPPPEDRPQASHSCGNGHLGCVNPRHLSWKSNSENQLDRRAHGTFGQKPKRLNAEQIKAARLLKGKMPMVEIATIFGVKRGCIEYWLRDDKPLLRTCMSRTHLYNLRKRAAVEPNDED